MSGADDFLSRWSRRKLEAKRPEPSEDFAPAAGPGDEVEATPAAGTQEPEAASGTEPPPDLPDPEELTAGSDLSAFLREGIPERLRNAALRRMWSLDPNIRDFVGDARDYAYDWNSPGGVPGFGPILPGDDVKAMVAAIFGSGERPEDAPLAAAKGEAREAVASDAPNEAGPVSVSEAQPETAAAPAPDEPGTTEARAAPPGLASEATGAVHEIASPASETRLRRHGGAKPI